MTEEENAEEKSEVSESAEESAEAPVEESTEESAEEPSVNSAEETGEELSEEPADEGVEEPAEESTEGSIEESTELPAEGETERITEAPSEEISEEESEETEKAEEDETSESAEVIQIADHLSEKDEEKHLDGSGAPDEDDMSDETTNAGAEEATTSEEPAGKSKKGLKITALVIAVVAVAWGVWYQLPSTKASRIRKQAEQAYAAADYADAAAAYQQLMGYGAQSEKICLHAVDAYADAGDHAEALALLQSSIERYPDSSALKDELEKLNPTVHFDPEGGSFTDPVTIQMRSEGTEQIRYSIEREGASAKSEEIEYATPAELRYSGSYTVRAHGIAKDGEAGDEFTQHYEIKLDPNKYHLDDWNETADGVQYLDAEGRFLTGWQTIDEKKYYFDEDGYRATGKTDIDRDSYFFDADGVMQTGWQQDDDGWYFFDETGKMLRDVWIEDTYYVDSDGKMLMDTTTPDGTKVDANGRKISDLAKIFEEHPDAMVVIQSADRKNEGEYSTFPAKAYYKHTSDKPEGDAYDTTVRISNHAWLHYIDKNLPRALVTDAYRFLPHIGILKPTIDENGIITEFDFILGSQG